MWTLDQLKAQLKQNPKVKSWLIIQEHVQRRERYFMLDGSALITDQDREVHTQNVILKLAVHLGKPGRQGEVTKKLFKIAPLGPQLEAAIEAAVQTDHQEWAVPTEIPSQLPSLPTSDPRMAEDLEGSMRKLTAEIEVSVAQKRHTTFNSAELFLSVHDREFHLSNGLTHRTSQSRIYTEAAFSYSRKTESGQTQADEYLSAQWAVSLDDLSIAKLFEETSERAEHSLHVQKPVTGKYPVIVDADVLATLFNGHMSQLTAANSYNGLPFIKPGQELIPEASTEEDHDLLTITLDPSLSFGADTGAVSEQGILQKPLKLVQANRVLATATDKQHADYLGLSPTTALGNIVVEPGSLTHHELTQAAPLVLEILQFSGLFADPNSGTFSSEIRLARLFDNTQGTVTYLKGGSLSGSISENFRRVKLSKNRVKRAHFSSNSMRGEGYFGPEYALLSAVSVVG